MFPAILSRTITLTCGALFPAYMSFKALRTKNLKSFINWMMYWIVFAIYLCMELISDIFLFWLPFYYEIKMLLILWILPTMGNGCRAVYQQIIHPFLQYNEPQYDRLLLQLRENGEAVLMQYVFQALIIGCHWIMRQCHNLPSNIIFEMLNNAVDSYAPPSGVIIYEEDSFQSFANDAGTEEEEDPSSYIAALARKSSKKTKAIQRRSDVFHL